MTNEPDDIGLRPAGPEDGRFLYEVYAGTRAEEMAAWGWPEAQQELFLKMQFDVRERAYGAAYADLEDRLILLEGRPAGRIMVSREGGAVTLVDIALLPEKRGLGIGTHLIRGLFAEADRDCLPVRLQVLRSNTAAARLYERLGFAATGGDDVYLHMERPPAGP